jgi:hypothetical protein
LDLLDLAGGSLAAAADDDVGVAEVERITVQRWTLPDEIEQICVEVESTVDVFLVLRRRILWRLCEDCVEPLPNGLGPRNALVTGQCLEAEVNVDGNFQLSEILVTDVGANLIEDLKVSTVRDGDNNLVANLLNQISLEPKLTIAWAESKHIRRLEGPVSHLPSELELAALVHRDVIVARGRELEIVPQRDDVKVKILVKDVLNLARQLNRSDHLLLYDNIVVIHVEAEQISREYVEDSEKKADKKQDLA